MELFPFKILPYALDYTLLNFSDNIEFSEIDRRVLCSAVVTVANDCEYLR